MVVVNFPTLVVRSPLMRGVNVRGAQWLLRGNGRFSERYLSSQVDGYYGPGTAKATRQAKYWLGYPAHQIDGVFGEKLYRYLLPRTHKHSLPLPLTYRNRRKKRKAAIAVTGTRGWGSVPYAERQWMQKWVYGDTDCSGKLLMALARTARDLGRPIYIRSGWRSYAEQQYLYNLYLSGQGNLAARPGTSNHEGAGTAADCYVDGVALANVRGARTICARYGISFPVYGEAWHAVKV